MKGYLIFIIVAIVFFFIMIDLGDNPKELTESIRKGFDGKITNKYRNKITHVVVKTESDSTFDVGFLCSGPRRIAEVGDRIRKFPNDDYVFLYKDSSCLRLPYLYITESTRSDRRWPDEWKERWLEITRRPPPFSTDKKTKGQILKEEIGLESLDVSSDIEINRREFSRTFDVGYDFEDSIKFRRTRMVNEQFLFDLYVQYFFRQNDTAVFKSYTWVPSRYVKKEDEEDVLREQFSDLEDEFLENFEAVYDSSKIHNHRGEIERLVVGANNMQMSQLSMSLDSLRPSIQLEVFTRPDAYLTSSK